MNNKQLTIIADDDATLNARYAISIARKIGATIFLLPEDIVEVRPRLVKKFLLAFCFIFVLIINFNLLFFIDPNIHWFFNGVKITKLLGIYAQYS